MASRHLAEQWRKRILGAILSLWSKRSPTSRFRLNFDSYDLRKIGVAEKLVKKSPCTPILTSDEQAATLGYLTTYDPILSETIMTSDDPTRNGRYSRYGKDEHIHK